MNPARAAADPFASLQAERAQQLVQDIALIMQHFGREEPSLNRQNIASFYAGQAGCLVLRSTLDMPKDASLVDIQTHRWATAQLDVRLSHDNSTLFSAVCTDSEKLKNAHVLMMPDNLTYVAAPYSTGAWTQGIHSLAAGLRSLNSLTAQNIKDQPQPVRHHPT